MVVTRRRSLVLASLVELEQLNNAKKEKSTTDENDRPANADDNAGKKRKSSGGDQKVKLTKKKQQEQPPAQEPISVDVSILSYDEDDIDESLIDLIRGIYYSSKYECDDMEYRHVILPKALYELIPSEFTDRLLSETEWRSLGIRMSAGWYL
eukprot:Partr_v1_DN23309_c0_g1_i3_m18451